MKCLFSDEPEFSLQYFFVIESREIHYLIDFHTEKGIINEELYLDRKLLLQRMGSTAKSGITEKKVYTDLNNKVLFLRLFISTQDFQVMIKTITQIIIFYVSGLITCKIQYMLIRFYTVV